VSFGERARVRAGLQFILLFSNAQLLLIKILGQADKSLNPSNSTENPSP
jgi:hypothetical protein